MPSSMQDRIQQELDLIGRYTAIYSRRFSELIAELNQGGGPEAQSRCVRACVEAMNLMLSAQNQIALLLRQLAANSPRPSVTAA